MLISNSEIAMWLRCPRQWMNAYYYGAAPAEPAVTGAMILGTRIHVALQAWKDPAYQLDPVLVLQVLYRLAIREHPEHEVELRAELETAVIMVSGLAEWMNGDGPGDRLEWLAAERAVTVPLPGLPGVELRAKLDALVRDQASGQLAFLDWKTSANFERHEVLALDPQFRLYSLVMALLAASGQPEQPVLGGAVITLRRCKRTSRSTPPYYQYDQFRYNPADVEAEYRKVAQACREILAARAALDQVHQGGRDLAAVNTVQQSACRPVKIPDDCKWRCPFVALCPMQDDGSDWPGVLQRSGAFTQSDPYARYADDPLAAVRAGLAEERLVPGMLSTEAGR